MEEFTMEIEGLLNDDDMAAYYCYDKETTQARPNPVRPRRSSDVATPGFLFFCFFLQEEEEQRAADLCIRAGVKEESIY